MSAQGHVALRDVSFVYGRGAPAVLAGVDLDLADGEFFVLLGPSGCGKTTVLNLVAGFERATKGAVTVGDEPVAGPGPDRVVIFQGDDSLLGWLTVRQNVEFGLKVGGVDKRERREHVEAALRMVELAGQADKYPHQLSGGMKQRVQIARALVSDAPILLMDEPFGALDAQTRSALQDELARIWSETRRTVLFITHDIGEAIILADRIGVMTAGPAARLHAIVDNHLPRPRGRGEVEFARMYQRLEQAVSEGKRRLQEPGVRTSP
jgi:NitT/TauT family transport system ATP-binding protein